MNRITTPLLAVVATLAALAGLTAVGAGANDAGPAGRTRQMPVQRTALTCPRPSASPIASTTYTAYTPVSEGGDDAPEAGTAGLLPAPEYAPGARDDTGAPDGAAGREPAKPVAPLAEPGVPVSVTTERENAPALAGTAEGRLAPGWTVQQTTSVASGAGRGLQATACQTPDTAFWFAGAATVASRHDYVHLTNPDPAATVVDIELYGPDGRLEQASADGVTVPGHTSVPVLLSTLTSEPHADLAVEVTARTGRIGAQLEAVDERLGADWLAPATAPPGPLVMPGIPGDARTVRLMAFVPGEEDVTVHVGLAGPTGTITPAGQGTLSLSSGTLTAVDLGALTRGEPGSLVLTPDRGSGGSPVIAALRVTRGEGDAQELAFIAPTGPLEQRAIAAGNTPRGTALSLVAPGKAVKIEVTVAAGTEGGEAVTETHTVGGGTTLALAPQVPKGTAGRYALTVTRVGGGPLYASRTLAATVGGVPAFTIQTLPDDRSTVRVPEARQDPSILTR